MVSPDATFAVGCVAMIAAVISAVVALMDRRR
jgi:hypothetical protein